MYVCQCMYVCYREDVEAYVTKMASKSDLERTATGKDRGKTGVPLVSNYHLVIIFSHSLAYIHTLHIRDLLRSILSRENPFRYGLQTMFSPDTAPGR